MIRSRTFGVICNITAIIAVTSVVRANTNINKVFEKLMYFEKFPSGFR